MTDVELIVEMLSRGPCFYGHVVLLLDEDHGRARQALKALEAGGEIIWRANGLLVERRRFPFLDEDGTTVRSRADTRSTRG